jgi:transcriptional regulator with XRE-family HTH domain
MHTTPDDAPLPEPQIEQLQRRMGERLRAFREARRLTERDVATYAGVNQATWSRVELGRTSPRLRWLLQVQRLFGLESLETLFGDFPTRRFDESD